MKFYFLCKKLSLNHSLFFFHFHFSIFHHSLPYLYLTHKILTTKTQILINTKLRTVFFIFQQFIAHPYTKKFRDSRKPYIEYIWFQLLPFCISHRFIEEACFLVISIDSIYYHHMKNKFQKMKLLETIK
jgi:hypothetical protein